MTSVAVLGPGGVGGLIAAALGRAGADAGHTPITVVARPGTAERIARDGITVESAVLGDFVARPAATDRLSDPVDILFVTTKATTLEHALARVATSPGLVIPLLNGLDHLGVLRTRFGAQRVPAGVIRVESDRPAPAQVRQTSPAIRVELAADDAALAERLPAVVALLTGAGIDARIGAPEADVIWGKLVRLNALASTTAVHDRPLGEIRNDPALRAELIACIEETAAAANAAGATIDPAATLAELDGAHAGLGSSMQRDLAAGRTPELDAIQGSVLRAAARHHVSAPTVTRLAAAIAQRAGIDPPRLD